MKQALIIILLSISFENGKANDSVLISRLLSEVAALQYKQDGEYKFRKGMFYSYKKYAGYTKRKTPDNNIFFTGLIAFSLKNMLPHLSIENKKMAEQIIDNATSAFPHYQNKKKLPLYFFWAGGKPIMPNTFLIQHTSSLLATSEDIDDTVMLLMAMEASDSVNRKAKAIMDSAANGKRRTIKNTLKKYRHYPAHTTYLGSKMRIDFDLAVHCNVLYFILENKLPFNKHDSATLNLVQQMVDNKEYLKSPKFIAPYYGKPSVIIYHLSRLMQKFHLPQLEPYRNQLIDDIAVVLAKHHNAMEDVILRTSLMKLGAKVSPIEPETLNSFEKSNQEDFVFYHARAASQFNNPFKRLFLNFNLVNYEFYCPAYNKILLLEYLIEKNKSIND